MNELGGLVMDWLSDALPAVLGVLGFLLLIAFVDGQRSRHRQRRQDDPDHRG